MATTATRIDFDEGAAPAAPAAADVRIYAKADGLMYSKDDAGVETLMSSGPVGGLGAWTAYTPTWTGGSPAIGNGTLTGRYKALDAKTYLIQISLVWGSTTTPGASQWAFSLPAGVTSATGVAQVLPVHIHDSGTDHKLGVAVVESAATIISFIVPEGGITVGPGAPQTWATGDRLNITGIIEVA